MIPFVLATALAAPKIQEHTVDIDGVERTFHVHVPSSARSPGKRGAVVLFHGAGPDRSDDKGPRFARHTQMHLAAGEYGAILAVPSGVDGGWYPPQWAPEGVDDVKLARVIYRVLVEEYGAHPGRVAAAGFSAGGHMAMQWACNDSRVAGVVVVGAGLSEMQARKCPLMAPTPTLFVLGTKDPVNPYEGGAVRGAREREDGSARVFSAKRSGKYFARKNGCAREPKRVPVRAPNGRTIAMRDKHRGCRKGKVDVITVQAGHVWPLGGTKLASKGASAYIARFLKRRVWSRKLRG